MRTSNDFYNCIWNNRRIKMNDEMKFELWTHCDIFFRVIQAKLKLGRFDTRLDNGYLVSENKVYDGFKTFVMPSSVVILDDDSFEDWLDRKFDFCEGGIDFPSDLSKYEERKQAHEEKFKEAIPSPGDFEQAQRFILMVLRVNPKNEDFKQMEHKAKVIAKEVAFNFSGRGNRIMDVSFPIPVNTEFIRSIRQVTIIDDEYVEEWLKSYLIPTLV